MDMEITRYFRDPNLKKAEYPFVASPGTKIRVTSSSFFSAIFRLSNINSASGTRRVPVADNASTEPFSTKSGGTPSAAGEALQILPAIVARFWICMEPTSFAANCKALKASGNSLS